MLMKSKMNPKESPQIPAPKPPRASQRRFDDTFRRHAVALVQNGRSVKEVAEELGVSPFSLYEWQRKFRRQIDLQAPIPKTLEGLEEEIQRLREALHRSQLREEILKKSLGIFAEGPASPSPSSKR
jgi:transposase